MKLITLQNINVEIPYKKILVRLGYNFHKTNISDDYKNKLYRKIEFIRSFCYPKGCYIRLNIIEKNDAFIKLENNIIFKSNNIAKLLKNSCEVVLMGVTIGKEIVIEINELIKNEKASEAVVYDAVGSELADNTMNWMNNYIKTIILRERKKTTDMRYSVGYGDFELNNQKIFYELLNLKNFEVELNENFILTPEKTVTALCGIERIM
jgi:hypothetical protein